MSEIYSVKNFSINVYWSEQSQKYIATCNELLGCGSEHNDPCKAFKDTLKSLKYILKYRKIHNILPPETKLYKERLKIKEENI